MERLVDEFKFVQALAPQIPSTSTPDRVSMKNFGRVTVIISALNATTVTGVAVALQQSTAVAGTGAKTLAFDKVWLNNDTAASDTLVETAVTSDTFTLDTTNSKLLLAIIEVNAESFDTANGFDVFGVTTGDGVAQDIDVVYVMHDARYAPSLADSVIVD